MAEQTQAAFRHRSNGEETPKCVECGYLWPCAAELLEHGGTPPESEYCNTPEHMPYTEFFEDGSGFCYQCRKDFDSDGATHAPYTVGGEEFCIACDRLWPCLVGKFQEQSRNMREHLEQWFGPDDHDDSDVPFMGSEETDEDPHDAGVQQEGGRLWCLIGWDPVNPTKLYVIDHTFDEQESDMYADIAQSEDLWMVELEA